MMRASFAIVVAVWFAGCAPFTVTKGRVAYPDQGFEVDLPPGWTTLAYLPPRLTRLPYAALESEKLFLTRDGLELQGISISRSAIGGGPDATRTTIAGRMSPQQAGAMEVDHLRARPGLRDLDLLEHTPATVAGKPGFRLVYTWKTSRGLRLKGVEYGIVDGQWIYRLAYEAIARHYFDRDLSAFEATVASFRLVKERVWRGPAAPEWQREAFTALPS